MASSELNNYYSVYQLAKEFREQVYFKDPLELAHTKNYKIPEVGTPDYCSYVENVKIAAQYGD